MESYFHVDGVRLFVETQGEGPPVLLIPGLGAGTWLWENNITALREDYTVLMPELRGSGRSDKPDESYCIERFARDVKALLDQRSIGRTHVVGASMGGFVAQHLAARWPSRVDHLVLAATSLGGRHQVGPDGPTLCRLIRPRGDTRRERLEDGYELSFTKSFMEENPEALESITEYRLRHPQPEFAYYRQLLAGHAYDGLENAAEIRAPTLICGGKDDIVVPVDNAYALEHKIPDARVVEFDGKHMFFFERADTFNQVVGDFLSRGSDGDSN